jgi:DNA-binding LacI/PurR family transcriptional regulator
MATIADIAQRAGVSVSTVSYVLSGKRPISEPTKRRVHAAIAELDFHPHALGRALASRRTRTIAVLYPLVSAGLTEFHLDFFTAAAAMAGEHGYTFMLSTSAVEEADLLDLTRSGAVDGIIVMEVRLHDPRVALLTERGFPFTLIGHCEANDGISFVDFDFEAAVDTAVAHLAQLGHRRLGLVNRTPLRLAAGYGPAVRAEAGFTRALVEHGVTGVTIPCEPTYEAGKALARRLGAEWPELTAAIVPNNDALGGLVSGIHEAERHIPRDLSLVAMAPRKLARLFTPTMTTIDFPATEMGRRGAEMLIRQLEGGVDEPEQVLLHGELVVGRSTARPARRQRPTLAPVG